MEVVVQHPGDDKSCRLELWSQEDGVGKSTVTALLGLSLRDIGKKLGLLDVDLSGRY
jgi:septum formation inhibitor-activating ATPase MinD